MKRFMLVAMALLIGAAIVASGAAALNPHNSALTFHLLSHSQRRAIQKMYDRKHKPVKHKHKPPPVTTTTTPTTTTTTPTTTSTTTTTPTTTTTATTPTTTTTTTTTTPPATGFTKPPQDNLSGHWYWQIGGGSLPAMTGSGLPATANIWDTDYFNDADSLNAQNEAAGPSTVVSNEKASGKYAICYIEAGAQQTGFPDAGMFAAADFTNPNGTSTQMQGYPSEHWFDTLGFAGWSSGAPTVFPGGSSADQSAAADIAKGMALRIAGCATEGQQAIEPDDLDGYTNTAVGGGAGGGWGLTQTAAAGYEKWLAYTAHHNGLAAFQKNDLANVSADVGSFDGIVDEQCSQYGECSSLAPYRTAGKTVLIAEYSGGSSFCAADNAAGFVASLFNVNLSGGTYTPCRSN